MLDKLANFSENDIPEFSKMTQAFQQNKIDEKQKKLNLAFLQACQKGTVKDVENALKMGADINAVDGNPTLGVQGTSGLMFALVFQNYEVADYLIQNPKTDVNKVSDFYSNALIQAVDKKVPISVLESLLKRKDLNVNGQSSGGQTALHTAVWERNTEATKLLLGHPIIYVNFPNGRGDTPLHLAVVRENKEIVSALLEHPQINPMAVNNKGRTALHDAADIGYVEYVTLLSRNLKVNPNAQDNEGNTPLHLSVMSRHKEAAETLISSGRVNVSVQNDQEKTAGDYAADYETRRMLYQASRPQKRSLIAPMRRYRPVFPSKGNSLRGRERE